MRSGTGVIVGRFQTPHLHAGHRALFKAAEKNHDHILVFVGVSPLAATKRNPFDFQSQTEFLRAALNHLDARVTIMPLPDNRDDAAWVAELDRRIKEVVPRGLVQLYGGRDSYLDVFFRHSKGPISCYEQIAAVDGSSSTDIRKEVGRHPLPGVDFRCGVIYATQQQHDSGVPCADVAIIDRWSRRCIFGRKPGETALRFIGGHFDPKVDKSLEDTALREGREETGLAPHSPQYITSLKVDDWRYRNESSQIVTAFYLAYNEMGAPKPADDIEELVWVEYANLPALKVVPEHIPLLQALLSSPVFQALVEAK